MGRAVIVTDLRGVSPVFAYVLTLGITTLLIAGLLIAASGYVEGQREAVGENELKVVGQQISADIAATDRLSRTEGASNASVERDVPRTVVGSTYTVHVRTDGDGPTNPYLELTMSDPDVSVHVGLTLAPGSDLVESSVGGGTIVVVYDDTTGELEVRNE